MTVLGWSLAMFFYISGLIYNVGDEIYRYKDEPFGLKWHFDWRSLLWFVQVFNGLIINWKTLVKVLAR